MKKAVTVQEIEGEGLLALLGQNVALFCANYIYAGKLVGVNDTCVLLEDAKIVYETGPLTAVGWQDAQALPGPWYVQLSAVESFGAAK
jgi:hypothetical protein